MGKELYRTCCQQSMQKTADSHRIQTEPQPADRLCIPVVQHHRQSRQICSLAGRMARKGVRTHPHLRRDLFRYPCDQLPFPGQAVRCRRIPRLHGMQREHEIRGLDQGNEHPASVDAAFGRLGPAYEGTTFLGTEVRREHRQRDNRKDIRIPEKIIWKTTWTDVMPI